MTKKPNTFLSFILAGFLFACCNVFWNTTCRAQTVISPGGGLDLLFIERYVSGANVRYGPGTLYRNYGNGKAWGRARGGRGLPLRVLAETGIDTSSYSEEGFDQAGISAWTNAEFYITPYFLKDPPSYLESVPVKIYLNANVIVETLSTGDNAIAEAEAIVAFGYIGDPEHPEFYGRYTESQKIRKVLHETILIEGTPGYIKIANSYSSGVVSGFGLATAKSSVVFDPIIELDQQKFDELMGDETYPIDEYVGLYISSGVNTDECWLDIEPEEGDGDVDGSDLALYASGINVDGEELNEDFGRIDCACLITSYWAMYFTEVGGTEYGPYYIHLIQDGEMLTGSWICDESGMITGTLQGTDISLSWDEEGEMVTISGQVDGNNMSGAYGENIWRAEKIDEPQCGS
jgi:hypothetical protein